jgi:hypothetical protein
MNIVMIGIDVDKNVCSMAGLDASGAVVLLAEASPSGGMMGVAMHILG